jgi:hypothetical protein
LYIADHPIPVDKNFYTLDKNIKRIICRLIKVSVLISIRVSSYEDIIEAQRQSDFKEAGFEASRR